jgi:hypothetical protein
VRAGSFPAEAQSTHMAPRVLEELVTARAKKVRQA